MFAWRNDFLQFLKDMGIRPDGKSLDRIDNDGDYKPDNCKWSTRTEQQLNRSVKSQTGHSRIDKNGKTFIIRFTHNGVRRSYGSYATIALAVEARDLILTMLQE